MSLQQIIRETSNDIWNQSGKHTHAELDASLNNFAHRILTVAFEATELKKEAETMEYDHADGYARGWNAANESRRAKEKEVLSSLTLWQQKKSEEKSLKKNTQVR